MGKYADGHLQGFTRMGKRPDGHRKVSHPWENVPTAIGKVSPG